MISPEWAAVFVPIGFGGMSWAVKKQLEINGKVRQNTADIASLIKNSDHTRSRVDAIFDHLLGDGSTSGRGSQK